MDKEDVLKPTVGNESGLEHWEYGSKDPSRWPRGTLYPQKLAVTSPTGGDRSVGIVRSRTKATEFSLGLVLLVGNEILHEISNDNGIRLVNFATA
jgi:hypothetical protein